MNRLNTRVPWILVMLATVFSLQQAAQPLPAAYPTPSAPPEQPRAEATPAPASVRDFTVFGREGLAALNTSAEALFDN